MLIILPPTKATFHCQRDLQAPSTTKGLQLSQTRHLQTCHPWRAPDTAWYVATHQQEPKSHRAHSTSWESVRLGIKLTSIQGGWSLRECTSSPAGAYCLTVVRAPPAKQPASCQSHSWAPGCALLKDLGVWCGPGRSKSAASWRRDWAGKLPWWTDWASTRTRVVTGLPRRVLTFPPAFHQKVWVETKIHQQRVALKCFRSSWPPTVCWSLQEAPWKCHCVPLMHERSSVWNTAGFELQVSTKYLCCM